MSKLNIRLKVLLAFGVLLALIVVNFVNTELTFNSTIKEATTIINDEAPKVNGIINIKYLTAEGHLWFEEIMGGDEGEDVNEVYELWTKAIGICDALLAAGPGEEATPEQENTLTQVVTLKELLGQLLDIGKQRYENDGGTGSNMDEVFDQAYEGVMEQANQIEASLGAVMSVHVDEMAGDVKTTQIVSLTVFIIILGVSIGFSIFVTRSISSGFNTLLDGTKKVAEGDYSYRFNTSRQDEFGSLEDAFDALTQNVMDLKNHLETEKSGIQQKVDHAIQQSEAEKRYLSKSIDLMLQKMSMFAKGDLEVRLKVERDDEIGRLYKGFNVAVQNVRKMINQVHASILRTTREVTEISSNTSELVSNMQNQATEASSVASGIEEMIATIQSNASHASSAADVTKETESIAIQGGEVVQQVIKKITQLSTVVQTSAASIKRLGDSSAQIGEIALVISDIADQTNLLALNAAIEAARAGEQGKGFAVVADEVRKLAERTTSATKEIEDKIRRIQQDTHGTVDSIHQGTIHVEESIELADKAGAALENVVGKVQEAALRADEIAVAVNQQSETNTFIAERINTIATLSQDSVNSTTLINDSTDNLNSLVENLGKLIGMFNINTTGTHVEQEEPVLS